jgi:hypothetical protein
MKRRAAVKGIILFSLGTGILFSCTDKYKAIRDLGLNHFEPLNKELDLLEKLSNIIVPLNSIPELAKHTPLPYIFTMLDDVYEPEARKVFLEGYQRFDEYVEIYAGKKFTQLNDEEQSTLVLQLNNHEEGIDKGIQDFYDIVKNESIEYLVTSEYYQRNINYYEMAPGRFKGEVLISELRNANDV